ncbi:MAG: RusA family crossover junction endodeoxyribonuclease [Candidatus Paceibacterota bacterium]
MKKELTITIPGKPIAKKRPRFFRKGQYVGTYNDQRTEEGRWLFYAQEQIQEMIPQGTPVELRCVFHMPVPKGTSKKKRESLLYHTKKPDLDNLVKFVKDCLNGVLWHDDGQVSELHAGKLYRDEPQTVLTVRWDEE